MITLASWAAAVAYLTLSGGDAAHLRVEEMPSFCLLCGSRGTADAILNVVLFVPLGLALGGTRRGLGRAIVAGFAISACIESIQLFVPGRHPTISDLLWNMLGAAVGVWLFTRIRRRLTGRRRVDVAWGAVLAVGFTLAGVLAIPAPTDDDYWGQWTPDLGFMPQYEGRVLEARVNELELPSRRIDHPGSDASLLHMPWVVEGTFLVGPPPPSVSPILSIYDGHQREMALLGAHRDDLVFRERMLAHRLRFDVPDVRIPGAFEPLAVGDTAVIRGGRADGSLCLRLAETRVEEVDAVDVGIDQAPLTEVEQCGLGISPGRSWGFLLYVEGPREWFRDLVDVGWLAILFFPVGFFGGSWRRMAVGTGIGMVGLVVAVTVTPLILGSWRELVACAVGVALGRGSVRVVERLAGSSQPPAELSISASV